MTNNYFESSISDMLQVKDQRKTEDAQLWVVGCSTTHGIGVTEDQRYGQIIASKLNLPVSYLTWPGSSIEWAADQILRSDIRKGDIVVWGLTAIGRRPYYDPAHSVAQLYSDNVLHLLVRLYEKNPKLNEIVPIDQLYNDDAIYRALTSVHQVVNVCNKLNITLILGGIYIMEQDIGYFEPIPNFVNLLYERNNSDSLLRIKPTPGSVTFTTIDRAADGIHPGPLTHQWYADQILSNLAQWKK